MAEVDPRDDPVAVRAAERVMLELWTILSGFTDAMTIVGGSAPPLLTGHRADDPYVGTLDVDLVVDPIGIPDEVYRTIADTLRGRDYVQLVQPFQWLRSVTIDGRSIDVEVDLLARQRLDGERTTVTNVSAANQWLAEPRVLSSSALRLLTGNSRAFSLMDARTRSRSASLRPPLWSS